MPWLLLAAALSFGFGQLFKWSQRRGCHGPTVVAANYLTLAALLAGYHAGGGTAWATPASLRVGGAMGLSFAVSMLLMTRALERIRVAVVLTAFRLALVIPVAASVGLWGEVATAWQRLGIGLALVALVSMTVSLPRPGPGAQVVAGAGTGATGRGSRVSAGALLTVLSVFVAQGLGQVCLRWVHYAGLDGLRLAVLMVCAATAGVLVAAVVACQAYRPRARDLGMGVGIGAYNLLCLAVLLTALSRLEGTRFFPVQGCLVVLLDCLSAHFGWKERLGRLAVVGAGLGAVSIALVM